MRQFLVRAVPIVTVIVFIVIMLSDNYLKHSFNENDNVVKSIELIMDDVKSNNWDDAYNKLQILDKAWITVVKRVQFSAERDEINNFNRSIARLRGAILAKDKANALMELSEAYNQWDNVGK